MNVHSNVTFIHTNYEIYTTALVELFCTHSTVSLHFNNYMATFLAGKCVRSSYV